MSYVSINADGREIRIDHDMTDLQPLADTALRLWDATTSGPRMTAGFASASFEKSAQWDHDRKRPVRAEDK